jgi:lipid-A-disaccharide synthase-like uncharacterized protein
LPLNGWLGQQLFSRRFLVYKFVNITNLKSSQYLKIWHDKNQ